MRIILSTLKQLMIEHSEVHQNPRNCRPVQRARFLGIEEGPMPWPLLRLYFTACHCPGTSYRNPTISYILKAQTEC